MSSYGTILKTTGLVGGARVFTIGANLAKAKVIASLLGPVGIGIYGLYQSLAEMLVAVGDLGISQSGVRQVALANAKGDMERVSVVYSTMRQTVLFFASFLSILMCLLARILSRWLLGSEIYKWGICVLSIYVFCNILSKTQLATLNGMRHIRDMTFSQIAGAVAGGVLACTMVFFWREQGIAFAFAGLGGGLLVSSWLFLRRLKIPLVKLDWGTRREEWKGLLGLGLGLVFAGVAAHVTNYCSQQYIRYSLGLEAVGIYQSCWSVSNMYVGLVLSAMGVDFLPRIMRNINDSCMLRKNLNEQMELGLVFCLPVVIATFVFAPLVLRILYSNEFVSAAFIIRWQIIGIALRLLTWPLGYLLIALGRTKDYVFVQLLFYGIELLMLVFFVRFWGINGLGPQFFFAYLIYFAGVYLLGAKLVQYRMSPLLKKACCVAIVFLALAAINLQGLGHRTMHYYFCGFFLVLLSGGYSWRVIRHSFGLNLASALFRKKASNA